MGDIPKHWGRTPHGCKTLQVMKILSRVELPVNGQPELVSRVSHIFFLKDKKIKASCVDLTMQRKLLSQVMWVNWSGDTDPRGCFTPFPLKRILHIQRKLLPYNAEATRDSLREPWGLNIAWNQNAPKSALALSTTSTTCPKHPIMTYC